MTRTHTLAYAGLYDTSTNDSRLSFSRTHVHTPFLQPCYTMLSLTTGDKQALAGDVCLTVGGLDLPDVGADTWVERGRWADRREVRWNLCGGWVKVMLKA